MTELSLDDPRYPARVRDLADPPPRLWIDGDLTSFDPPAVAIVGTRRMTGYGERVARELAQACAVTGIVVVSGFAQGIDSAAHRGALDAGGRTIAVLGESLASFVATVRARRRPLVPRVRASGALVSEFAAPLSPKAWTFVRRNATIAALGIVTVVVEAGERSGALITAADARRLGRRVFAVPGPLGSVASVGTNALIAEGIATALVGPDQLLRAVGVGAMPRAHELEVDPVLEALRDGPLGFDELLRRTRMREDALRVRVAMLLMHAHVAAVGDGRFRRT